MSEAPERIWTSKCGKTLVHDGMKRFETDVEYIRADHVDAMLKAEREKALREAMDMVSARIVQAASGGENLLSPNAIWTGIEALLLLHAPGAGQPRDSRPAP